MTDLAPRATPRQWLAGARPRTLPIAVAPVVAGSGLAFFAGGFRLAAAVLALVVSLALQVGVNYANDYSDGIRGADADRIGPVRLVGAGLAAPAAVKRAALTSFAVAGVAGLGLVIMTGHWWLLGVGAACVLAAWYYTGGRHPYGYHGLGEVFVFVFFGLVAVGGTAYVQVGAISWATLLTGVAIGALACAILVVNNLRDIVGDTEVGKRTLATRLGPTADPRPLRDARRTCGRHDHRRCGAHLSMGRTGPGRPAPADPGPAYGAVRWAGRSAGCGTQDNGVGRTGQRCRTDPWTGACDRCLTPPVGAYPWAMGRYLPIIIIALLMIYCVVEVAQAPTVRGSPDAPMGLGNGGDHTAAGGGGLLVAARPAERGEPGQEDR